MEGRQWEGTGGLRNICRAGEGEGQAGTARAGSSGSALLACLPSGSGAQGRDLSCLSPAACTMSLGVVVKAALQKDFVVDPKPTEIPLPPGTFPIVTLESATVPRWHQGQSPDRCPDIQGPWCISGAEAFLGHYCSVPASSPLRPARPAPRSVRFKILSCSWFSVRFSVIVPFLATGRGCIPSPATSR